MKQQTTVVTIVALAIFSFDSRSEAGVSGNAYTTTIMENGDPLGDVCLKMTPTLNLVIFAIGDCQMDDGSANYRGSYWELDLIVFGVFGASVENGSSTVSFNGTHLFSDSISGSGNWPATIGPFTFVGKIGCD